MPNTFTAFSILLRHEGLLCLAKVNGSERGSVGGVITAIVVGE
jgi:hypothetical protein